MRRFSAGIRVVTALLCTVLLVSHESRPSALAVGVLLAYSAWSGWLLWIEASGRSDLTGSWPYWIDVAWACAAMKLFVVGSMMMVITLVHPVVLTSIGYGVSQGVLLALVAALGMLLNDSGGMADDFELGWRRALPALLVLVLVPAAAVLSRPMGVLRRRLALIVELEAELDSRRGLEPICGELVQRLCAGTHADVVALVLPSRVGAPAMIASPEDGSFRARPEVHASLESQLSQLPPCAVSHVVRSWWDPRRRTRLHAKVRATRALSAALAEMARMLSVRSLHVVPLTRYAQQHGHFIIGYRRPRTASQDLAALTSAAPELLRIVEHAALVDQLQEESAGHERARIGRDLHDSAIQPYLGLKYAVECVALRIPPDNPARAEVDALAELVNSEVASLRELISGLRTGNDRGDSALVPAVRRQAARFALLFGIGVEVDCPDSLPTTRALAAALFHMVNEVLNNVRKHTHARRVWLALSIDDSHFKLHVRDDASSAGSHGSPGNRLPVDFKPTSLTERATELGGTLTVSSPDGLNTELLIRIPL